MAKSKSATDGPVTTTTTTTTGPLPGTGKPAIIIGDKNYTEQFVLGELYAEALTAQGYKVQELNRNIGPTSVTLASALAAAARRCTPSTSATWDYDIAGTTSGGFKTVAGAYVGPARGVGRCSRPDPLLDARRRSATPPAIACRTSSAPAGRGPQDDRVRHARLRGSRTPCATIGDLRKVASKLTLGGPPQFEQSNPGLPSIEQVYGFAPAAYTPLDIGAQYPELDNDSIQAADVNTTDGQLASGDYTLLRDPRNVFGWGQAVPVVSTKVLNEMGPVFAATINKVDALLTLANIRWLNAEVDVAHRDPVSVARQFLQTHGLILPGSPS